MSWHWAFEIIWNIIVHAIMKDLTWSLRTYSWPGWTFLSCKILFLYLSQRYTYLFCSPPLLRVCKLSKVCRIRNSRRAKQNTTRTNYRQFMEVRNKELFIKIYLLHNILNRFSTTMIFYNLIASYLLLKKMFDTFIRSGFYAQVQTGLHKAKDFHQTYSDSKAPDQPVHLGRQIKSVL